jgi:hypothetical protein
MSSTGHKLQPEAVLASVMSRFTPRKKLFCCILHSLSHSLGKGTVFFNPKNNQNSEILTQSFVLLLQKLESWESREERKKSKKAFFLFSRENVNKGKWTKRRGIFYISEICWAIIFGDKDIGLQENGEWRIF